MGLKDVFKQSIDQGRIDAEAGRTPRWLGLIFVAMLGMSWALTVVLAMYQNLWAIPMLVLVSLWTYSTVKQLRKGNS